MFARFWIWRHSSSKWTSARNKASKNIQKLCAKNKKYHAQNERTSKNRKWKAAQNDGQNDDRTMTIFLVSESLQTHPHREPKMASLLVRHYSILFSFSLLLLLLLFLLLLLVLLLLFFSITCSFHVFKHQQSGTIGDTQKTMTISATSFRGCNRYSPLLICVYFIFYYLYIIQYTSTSSLNDRDFACGMITV